MFVVDVFIHFHTCHRKDGDSNIHKYLKQPLPEEEKKQTKSFSFLRPATEKEYNYSMDVVYVEVNHTSLTRPFTHGNQIIFLGANPWESNYFSRNIAVASPT